MEYVLGIDVGTSSCKATLVDPTGHSIAAASDGYTFDAPNPEWAEQDPALWWRGVLESVARVREAAGADASQIVALGVTGQMHSAVLLDERLDVVRPPLLWCDQRPAVESARAEAGFPQIREITLNPLLPAFTLSKLLWSREHEPEAYLRVRHVLLAKDLLRLRLTGLIATDPSDAAGTAMYDGRTWAWSEEILEHFAIRPEWLPQVVPSSEVAGRLMPEVSGVLGLRAGTPVVTGGGDQAAQAVGLGVVDGNLLAAQIGTSGVIVAAAAEPVRGAFCHAVPDRWIRLDSLHAAGLSLMWIRDVVAPGDDIQTVLETAAAIPAGSEGLLFLPFLMGERAGLSASVPAAFVGLRPEHGRGHLVRAVLEGVAFELRRMRDAWFAEGEGPDEVRVVGGGMRNVLWQAILADAFGVPMTPLLRDSSYGAAVLAGMGIGWWQRAPEPLEARAVRPDPAGAAASGAAYGRYRQLYERLRASARQEGAVR